MGLYRKHNSNDAVLKLVGRDFGDAEYALTWDPEHFTWQRKDEPKPSAKESRTTTILDRVHVNEIVEAIDALGPCTLARLAAAVKIDKGNLFNLLKALVDAGVLCRNTDGHVVTYALAQQPAAAAQPPLLPGDSPMDTMDTTPTTDTTRTTPTTPTTDVAAPCPATAGAVPPTGGVHTRQHPWPTAPHRTRPKPPKPPKRKKR